MAVATALFTGGTAFAGGHHGHRSHRCAGGAIPSGTYSNITVAGACSVAEGAVNVTGSVNVRSGPRRAERTGNHHRGHDVTGAPGSMVGLGCQPPEYTGNSGHTCEVDPTGHSTIVVGGNVTLVGAVGMFLNGIKIRGNVTIRHPVVDQEQHDARKPRDDGSDRGMVQSHNQRASLFSFHPGRAPHVREAMPRVHAGRSACGPLLLR
jgi:hypothetical protein